MIAVRTCPSGVVSSAIPTSTSSGSRAAPSARVRASAAARAARGSAPLAARTQTGFGEETAVQGGGDRSRSRAACACTSSRAFPSGSLNRLRRDLRRHSLLATRQRRQPRQRQHARRQIRHHSRRSHVDWQHVPQSWPDSVRGNALRSLPTPRHSQPRDVPYASRSAKIRVTCTSDPRRSASRARCCESRPAMIRGPRPSRSIRAVRVACMACICGKICRAPCFSLRAFRDSRSVSAIAIIPARYQSTRFPGKALADIGGRPMIEHVYRRAAAARSIAVGDRRDRRRADRRRGRGVRRRRRA